MTIHIEAGTTYYRDINEQIRAAIGGGETNFELTRVFGQRYIGDALQEPVHIDIQGTPGNDMAAFMDGATLEVHGNAQDQVGNTMNAGRIVIHGRCGDAAGYGMRGGAIFVRDDAGWRCGIHMKEYQEKRPVIVIGRNAGSFLGEYMAGGIILLLGKPGRYVASGMHGGVIYLAHAMDLADLNPQLVQEELSDTDKINVEHLLEHFNEHFGTSHALDENYVRLRPKSSRPYSGLYT